LLATINVPGFLVFFVQFSNEKQEKKSFLRKEVIIFLSLEFNFYLIKRGAAEVEG
jgi:hypothetical protein